MECPLCLGRGSADSDPDLAFDPNAAPPECPRCKGTGSVRRRYAWHCGYRTTITVKVKGESKVLEFDHAPVRTLADMTEEEIAALERQYGAKVRRA